MKTMFESPQVEEVFGKAFQTGVKPEEKKALEVAEDDDEEDPLKQDEKQKQDIIRTFALNQIANIPTMFRSALTSSVLTSIIQFLVHVNYFAATQTSDDIQKLTQFKLLGLVQILHKIKLGDHSKGMRNSTDLWIAEVNHQIQIQSKNEEENPMFIAHAECLKFVKETVTSARLATQKKVKASTSEEHKLREKQTFKRLLAFELLFNNLALLLLVPEMLEEVEDNIEELKICFQKLDLTAENSGKRSKTKSAAAANPEKAEALEVLVDFLVSLLTKPQSFLRDIANFTFKQFCTLVSPKALVNLVEIVQTPNADATKMLFDEDEIEKDDEEEDDDEEDDDDEDDDDDDDSEDSD